MMSRISSSKLRMEDLKHRLSIILISSFIFFMKDVFFIIAMQNAKYNAYTPAELQEDLRRTIMQFTKPDFSHFLYILPLAVLMGVNAFHYLHDRSRVDFMHSLPIKRSRLYQMILSNDMLIFFVPYVISLLVQMGIVASYGYFNGEYLMWVVNMAIAVVFCFLLLYLLMIVAMLLTGQTIVGLLAFGAMASYTGLIYWVIGSYADTFFMTYGKMSPFLENLLIRLGPGYLAFAIMTDAIDGLTIRYLCAIAWIFVLLVLAFFLYKKRPSESAGSAMAFQRGQKLIKTMITIPMALLTGALFDDLTMNHNILWMYFGIILGTVLFHGLVECIYRSDVRGLWANKKECFVLFIIAVLIALTFEVDLVKYDEFRPTADEVESVRVEQFLETYYGMDAILPEEKGITGEEKDKVLAAINEIRANPDHGDDYKEINLTYLMRNGQKKYRTYTLSEEEMKTLGETLFESRAFKESTYPVFSMETEDVVEVNIQHPTHNVYLKPSAQECQEMLQSLRDDIAAMKYTEVVNSYPVCKLDITSYVPEGTGTIQYMPATTYDIYPSYVKTIAFIKAHGGAVGSHPDTISINKLKFTLYDDDDTAQEYVIADKDFIDSMKDRLYYDDLYSYTLRTCVLESNELVQGVNGDAIYYFRVDNETLEMLKEHAK